MEDAIAALRDQTSPPKTLDRSLENVSVSLSSESERSKLTMASFCQSFALPRSRGGGTSELSWEDVVEGLVITSRLQKKMSEKRRSKIWACLKQTFKTAPPPVYLGSQNVSGLPDVLRPAAPALLQLVADACELDSNLQWADGSYQSSLDLLQTALARSPAILESVPDALLVRVFEAIMARASASPRGSPVWDLATACLALILTSCSTRRTATSPPSPLLPLRSILEGVDEWIEQGKDTNALPTLIDAAATAAEHRGVAAAPALLPPLPHLERRLVRALHSDAVERSWRSVAVHFFLVRLRVSEEVRRLDPALSTLPPSSPCPWSSGLTREDNAVDSWLPEVRTHILAHRHRAGEPDNRELVLLAACLRHAPGEWPEGGEGGGEELIRLVLGADAALTKENLVVALEVLETMLWLYLDGPWMEDPCLRLRLLRAVRCAAQETGKETSFPESEAKVMLHTSWIFLAFFLPSISPSSTTLLSSRLASPHAGRDCVACRSSPGPAAPLWAFYLARKEQSAVEKGLEEEVGEWRARRLEYVRAWTEDVAVGLDREKSVHAAELEMRSIRREWVKVMIDQWMPRLEVGCGSASAPRWMRLGEAQRRAWKQAREAAWWCVVCHCDLEPDGGIGLGETWWRGRWWEEALREGWRGGLEFSGAPRSAEVLPELQFHSSSPIPQHQPQSSSAILWDGDHPLWASIRLAIASEAMPERAWKGLALPWELRIMWGEEECPGRVAALMWMLQRPPWEDLTRDKPAGAAAWLFTVLCVLFPAMASRQRDELIGWGPIPRTSLWTDSSHPRSDMLAEPHVQEAMLQAVHGFLAEMLDGMRDERDKRGEERSFGAAAAAMRCWIVSVLWAVTGPLLRVEQRAAMEGLPSTSYLAWTSLPPDDEPRGGLWIVCASRWMQDRSLVKGASRTALALLSSQLPSVGSKTDDVVIQPMSAGTARDMPLSTQSVADDDDDADAELLMGSFDHHSAARKRRRVGNGAVATGTGATASMRTNGEGDWSDEEEDEEEDDDEDDEEEVEASASARRKRPRPDSAISAPPSIAPLARSTDLAVLWRLALLREKKALRALQQRLPPKAFNSQVSADEAVETFRIVASLGGDIGQNAWSGLLRWSRVKYIPASLHAKIFQALRETAPAAMVSAPSSMVKEALERILAARRPGRARDDRVEAERMLFAASIFPLLSADAWDGACNEVAEERSAAAEAPDDVHDLDWLVTKWIPDDAAHNVHPLVTRAVRELWPLLLRRYDFPSPWDGWPVPPRKEHGSSSWWNIKISFPADPLNDSLPFSQESAEEVQAGAGGGTERASEALDGLRVRWTLEAMGATLDRTPPETDIRTLRHLAVLAAANGTWSPVAAGILSRWREKHARSVRSCPGMVGFRDVPYAPRLEGDAAATTYPAEILPRMSLPMDGVNGRALGALLEGMAHGVRLSGAGVGVLWGGIHELRQALALHTSLLVAHSVACTARRVLDIALMSWEQDPSGRRSHRSLVALPEGTPEECRKSWQQLAALLARFKLPGTQEDEEGEEDEVLPWMDMKRWTQNISASLAWRRGSSRRTLMDITSLSHLLGQSPEALVRRGAVLVRLWTETFRRSASDVAKAVSKSLRVAWLLILHHLHLEEQAVLAQEEARSWEAFTGAIHVLACPRMGIWTLLPDVEGLTPALQRAARDVVPSSEQRQLGLWAALGDVWDAFALATSNPLPAPSDIPRSESDAVGSPAAALAWWVQLWSELGDPVEPCRAIESCARMLGCGPRVVGGGARARLQEWRYLWQALLGVMEKSSSLPRDAKTDSALTLLVAASVRLAWASAADGVFDDEFCSFEAEQRARREGEEHDRFDLWESVVLRPLQGVGSNILRQQQGESGRHWDAGALRAVYALAMSAAAIRPSSSLRETDLAVIGDSPLDAGSDSRDRWGRLRLQFRSWVDQLCPLLFDEDAVAAGPSSAPARGGQLVDLVDEDEEEEDERGGGRRRGASSMPPPASRRRVERQSSKAQSRRAHLESLMKWAQPLLEKLERRMHQEALQWVDAGEQGQSAAAPCLDACLQVLLLSHMRQEGEQDALAGEDPPTLLNATIQALSEPTLMRAFRGLAMATGSDPWASAFPAVVSRLHATMQSSEWTRSIALELRRNGIGDEGEKREPPPPRPTHGESGPSKQQDIPLEAKDEQMLPLRPQSMAQPGNVTAEIENAVAPLCAPREPFSLSNGARAVWARSVLGFVSCDEASDATAMWPPRGPPTAHFLLTTLMQGDDDREERWFWRSSSFDPPHTCRAFAQWVRDTQPLWMASLPEDGTLMVSAVVASLDPTVGQQLLATTLCSSLRAAAVELQHEAEEEGEEDACVAELAGGLRAEAKAHLFHPALAGQMMPLPVSPLRRALSAHFSTVLAHAVDGASRGGARMAAALWLDAWDVLRVHRVRFPEAAEEGSPHPLEIALDVHYGVVSQAALAAGRPATALLAAELLERAREDEAAASSLQAGARPSTPRLQAWRELSAAYSKLEDPTASVGVRAPHAEDAQVHFEVAAAEEDWVAALGVASMALREGRGRNVDWTRRAASALSRSGLDGLLPHRGAGRGEEGEEGGEEGEEGPFRSFASLGQWAVWGVAHGSLDKVLEQLTASSRASRDPADAVTLAALWRVAAARDGDMDRPQSFLGGLTSLAAADARDEWVDLLRCQPRAVPIAWAQLVTAVHRRCGAAGALHEATLSCATTGELGGWRAGWSWGPSWGEGGAGIHNIPQPSSPSTTSLSGMQELVEARAALEHAFRAHASKGETRAALAAKALQAGTLWQWGAHAAAEEQLTSSVWRLLASFPDFSDVRGKRAWSIVSRCMAQMGHWRARQGRADAAEDPALPTEVQWPGTLSWGGEIDPTSTKMVVQVAQHLEQCVAASRAGDAMEGERGSLPPDVVAPPVWLRNLPPEACFRLAFVTAMCSQDDHASAAGALALGTYADTHLQRLTEAENTPDAVSQAHGVNWRQEQLDEVTRRIRHLQEQRATISTDLRRLYGELRSVVNRDKTRGEQAKRMQVRYRELALAALGRFLCTAPYESGTGLLRAAYRWVSLWVGPSHRTPAAEQPSRAVLEVLARVASRIPTRRLWPVLPQLSASLGGSNGEERGADDAHLKKILARMVAEAPYVCAGSLLMMEAAGRSESGDGTPTTRKGELATRVLEEAVRTAGDPVGVQRALWGLRMLFEAYRALGRFSSDEVVGGAELPLSSVEIKWPEVPNALRDDQDRRPRHFTWPDFFSERSFSRAWSHCLPILTADQSESDLLPAVRWVGFAASPTFGVIPSGLSKPKLVSLLGSDGHVYRQIAKGQDEMRQDAVMLQFFETVNALLRANPASRAEHLRLRTYRVVPFDSHGGVIEMVPNATAWGEYLVGPKLDGGAHARLRPNDWTPKRARQEMSKVAKAKDVRDLPRTLLSTFETICAKFKPVFHYFFLENFPDAREWVARRRAYTRSVATSSMAGYIVGLGDRHAQNLLLDRRTGEIVHIDFGLVFDQGGLLRIPERVPFRLTRDMVAGMGVTAVDGGFRAAAETTMAVLREGASTVLAVLEAFVHDPLCRWSDQGRRLEQFERERADADAAVELDVEDEEEEEAFARGVHGRSRSARPGGFTYGQRSASRANSVSPRGSPPTPFEGASAAQFEAEQSLSRCRQKLQGADFAGSASLSVAAQVDRLISDAQDPVRLSQIFHGWQAWV